VATDSTGRSATNFTSIYPSTAFPPRNWASFYTFTSGAQDASNLYNGTLDGGASIENTLPRGNVLNLSGSGEYVRLPAGAGAAQTVSGWVKWEGGSKWERVFDFGQNNTDYFFLTTADGSSLVQCSITTDVGIYNQEIESPSSFPVNQWTLVSVVMDGREGILYLNGNAVAVNNSVNLLPSDVAPTQCYLGKSQYPTDPYFYGMMSSVELNSSPLALAQLIAPIPTIVLPTNGTVYSNGTTLTYSGTATDYSGKALPATSYSWSGELYTNGVASPAFGPVTGVTVGTYRIPTNSPISTNVFYQITLTVIDTNGYQQSVSRDVFPVLGPPTIGAAQAGNGFSLSWPQWAGRMELYTTTNLGAGGWTLVTNIPTSSNNTFTVTIPMTNFLQFFRLQSPP
jgi:hypothetical protein